ncbi:MAG: TldD/PmbA family protein [Bryobacteraceae bacterium]
MMTRQQVQTLIEKALSFSRFPDCSVTVDDREGAQVRFANNGITTAGFAVERTVSISSTREGRTGSVSLNEIDDASLRAAVEQSEKLAAISLPNPEHMDPLGPQKYPETAGFDGDTAIARSPVMTPHVKAVIDAAVGKKLVAAGFFLRTHSVDSFGNKKGNFGYSRSTDSRMSSTVRAADGSSSGWAGHPSVRIREINGAELGETAIQKCLRWTKPQRIEPGKYTVVLEPTAASDLCASVGFSFNARGAEEGRSFLSRKGGGTQVGEKLFPDHITLYSDPLDRRYPGSPWGAGGLPSRRMVWIEKGVVRNLSYDRYWAAKSGKEPTPGANSLILQGGEGAVEDLIREVERGLLVTRFWYIRGVNPQTLQATGLTRDGLFLIEKGRISGAAVNMRFNESPVRLLQNSMRLGRSIRCRGGEGFGMIAPAILARDFTLTSVSDAV